MSAKEGLLLIWGTENSPAETNGGAAAAPARGDASARGVDLRKMRSGLADVSGCDLYWVKDNEDEHGQLSFYFF